MLNQFSDIKEEKDDAEVNFSQVQNRRKFDFGRNIKEEKDDAKVNFSQVQNRRKFDFGTY
jgi:hypothetical protein